MTSEEVRPSVPRSSPEAVDTHGMQQVTAALAVKAAQDHSATNLLYRKSFQENLESLLQHDCIRLSRLLETVQCAILYSFLGLAAGLAIDGLLRPLYPTTHIGKPEGEPIQNWNELIVTLGIAVLQIVLAALGVFYVRKIAALVPFFWNRCPTKYLEGYHVHEIEGEIALSLIFIGSQVNFVDQLVKVSNFLRKRHS